ncbi:MAG: hypothetical protein EU531_01530 [Promethearchaeota archaeon]|nr:MAG: hypothetical protein EU531_01530 [Candidatus Lokiarchaeota archaeon]
MIIKVKIVKQKKKAKKNSIELWVQRKKELDQDISQIFQFFESQLDYKNVRRIYPYYKITSNNPAMILSLLSSLQELIPEIYFNNDNTVQLNKEVHL